MEVFNPASHHDILVLIIQVAVLLLAARTLGEIAQRLGQPAVVGELLAGIVLGPSLLSGLFPVVEHWIVPQTPVQGYLIELVSMFGAMFLLIITGLETDIPLIKRKGKKALSISIGGLVLPFLSGFIMAIYLPDFLVADSSERLVFDLFVATAMAISSIPVVAKVLMDLNLMRRDLGQTILAAGMVDDTTAWILLSIILGLASGDVITAGTVIYAILKIVAFMVLSFTIGKWLVKKGLHYVQDHVQGNFSILTFVVVVAFLFGAVAQAIKVESVLGAFVAGIIFGMLPRLPKDVVHKLEAIALGIFAPIFFAVSGLKVDIPSLMEPQLLVVTGVVIAIAILGKLIGAYVGARVVGLGHWNSLAYGSALNARGAVEIIVASIGLSMGILSQDMYSIIVLMAMVTSIMAPSLLKWSVGKIKMDDEEKERLEKEELQAESLVAGIHRVLMPIRSQLMEYSERHLVGKQQVEAKILNLLGKSNQISITLMTVAQKEHFEGSKAYLEEVAKSFEDIEIEIKVVESKKPVDAILDEAKKGYELLVLGATEKNTKQAQIFNPIIDELVRLSPCPTAVVQSEQHYLEWKPARILVPTNGSKAAKNAAELGFYIAGATSSNEVLVLNVLEEEKSSRHFYRSKSADNRKELRASIVEENRKLGESLKVKTHSVLHEDENAEQGIINVSNQNSIDLIVIGTNIHPGTGRLYLGTRVERILENAKCPVLVFNT